jgi:tellurite resistance protein TehA-like permease
VLLVGLVTFGTVALGLFWSTFPRGWRGVTRLGILLVAFVVIGGFVAPLITRALNRR